MTVILVSVVACVRTAPSPAPERRWRESYNGHLLLALSGAYSVWEEDGTLPTVIKWEGVNVFTLEYMRAGLALAVRMLDDPEGWMDEDVSYPNAVSSLVTGEPFIPRRVPFGEFAQTVREQHRNMLEGSIPLRMKIAGYPAELTTTGLCVMLCRAFRHFDQNGSFPGEIDTWESSYVRSTANSDLSAPEVLEARDAAWTAAGVSQGSSERAKAEAIFNFARDEWEWENYNNTRKGAVRTIEEKCGNCCDLSHAVIAMARLSGIPARYFHAQCHYLSGTIGHVVSQLFVEGEWHMADASNNDNEFGKVQFNGYESLHYYESLPF